MQGKLKQLAGSTVNVYGATPFVPWAVTEPLHIPKQEMLVTEMFAAGKLLTVIGTALDVTHPLAGLDAVTV